MRRPKNIRPSLHESQDARIARSHRARPSWSLCTTSAFCPSAVRSAPMERVFGAVYSGDVTARHPARRRSPGLRVGDEPWASRRRERRSFAKRVRSMVDSVKPGSPVVVADGARPPAFRGTARLIHELRLELSSQATGPHTPRRRCRHPAWNSCRGVRGLILPPPPPPPIGPELGTSVACSVTFSSVAPGEMTVGRNRMGAVMVAWPARWPSLTRIQGARPARRDERVGGCRCPGRAG